MESLAPVYRRVYGALVKGFPCLPAEGSRIPLGLLESGEVMKGILLVQDEAAFTVVAGLPVLTRALCAGYKGGIVDWLVLGAAKTLEQS